MEIKKLTQNSNFKFISSNKENNECIRFIQDDSDFNDELHPVILFPSIP